MMSLSHLKRWMFILLVVFVTHGEAAAQASTVTDSTTVNEEVKRVPGVDLAQGITEVTGVAISPLLGMSSVGAWKYFRADEASRTRLPWFCHPAVWGTGFAILGLCFLKDTLGTAVPGLLKKPLDMAELFENKASALVASTAFVPVIARQMAEHFADGQTAGATAALWLPVASMTGLSWVAISSMVIWTVASVVVFGAVWLTGHAINVLIVLSPFSLVDALLKLVRLTMLLIIGAAYVIAPWLAAGICIVLIVAAIWLAPATLRLAVFGSRYAADVLLPGFGRHRATDERPHAFTIGRSLGLPARTGGRLVSGANGEVAFRYRPWGVGRERSVPLPSGQPFLLKGLISPALAVAPSPQAADVKVVLLLPRYRGREGEVAQSLALSHVRDHALSRGATVVRTWWHEQVRGRTSTVADNKEG